VPARRGHGADAGDDMVEHAEMVGDQLDGHIPSA
jgi:hypothetical protein